MGMLERSNAMVTITTETLKSLAVGIICVIILIAGFRATSKKKGGGSSTGSNTPPTTSDTDKK